MGKLKFIQAMQKNPQLAKRVKQLRIKQEIGWGMIGQIIAQEFPELEISISTFQGIKIGNQIAGADLCDAAMEYLDEKVENGWN